MKIVLKADYRGVLTAEKFYSAGELEVPDEIGAALVKAGRAELVEEPETKPAPKPRKRLTRKTNAATKTPEK